MYMPQDPPILSVDSLAPLSSRPSMALDNLLAEVETARTTMIRAEQHLRLAYDGLQVSRQ